jgi:hypothetical protein
MPAVQGVTRLTASWATPPPMRRADARRDSGGPSAAPVSLALCGFGLVGVRAGASARLGSVRERRHSHPREGWRFRLTSLRCRPLRCFRVRFDRSDPVLRDTL